MNGQFNILFLGDGYKGKDAPLFDKDVELAKKAIMSTAPFSSRTDISFASKNVKSSLGCDDNLAGQGGVETVGCNVQKIVNAVKGIIPAPDLVIVFANNKGHAGFDGDKIITEGMGNHTSNPAYGCTFEQAAFYGRLPHEMGHYFGLPHQNKVGSKMNDGVNGGCAIWHFPFTSEEQQIITTKLNFITNH